MFRTINLEVVGDQPLHCENCERRVERMIKSLEGVDRVRAHSGNQRIEVLFDATVLQPEAITERLEDAGYKTVLAG